MKVEIREQVAPMHLVAARHIGPENQVCQAFGALMGWVGAHHPPIVGPTVAVYLDDPHTVPEAQRRSDAGIQVATGYLPEGEGVFATDLPGGRYAVCTHQGPYSGLGDSWRWFTSEGIASLQAQSDWTRPCFEVYLNMPGEVPDAELLTEIFVPVR